MPFRSPENGGIKQVEGGPMNPETRVMEAMTAFVKLYNGDGDLVRPGAQRHGVQVVEGDIFDKPSKGNYNFRIPRHINSETARALIGAKRVAWVCEDYRQFGEVVEALGLSPETRSDAVFGIAGGAAQPEQNRSEAMVELIASLSAANPDMEHILLVHDEVCGGANYYTGGKMKEIREGQGVAAEQTQMVDFRTRMVDALKQRGVNPKKIKVGFAVVEHDAFVEIK